MSAEPSPHRASDPRAPASRGRPSPEVRIRLARPEDVPQLVTLSRSVYGKKGAWRSSELRHHQEVFPEGQLVAEEAGPDAKDPPALLGMAVSLILDSAAWPPDASWRDVTGRGRLTTHDPGGDVLYGAGVAVRPDARGKGVARALYAAREALLERLGLTVIRAGARIPGYGAVADRMSAEDYVREVVEDKRSDPTLSFHLHMGFRVVAVARDYLPTDEPSRGWAAIVEWRREEEEG